MWLERELYVQKRGRQQTSQRTILKKTLLVYEKEDSEQTVMEESEQRLGIQDTKQHCAFKWTINHLFGNK